MTAMSTNSYLDNQVDRVEEMTSIVSKDAKTIEQLSGLHDMISGASLEAFAKNTSLYQMSFESIGRQSRVPGWSFSFEGEVERVGFLKRAWEMFKRFVRMIVENAQRVWNWIKNMYAKSDLRRKKLLDRLKALQKTFTDMKTKSRTAQSVEIALGADQAVHFIIDLETPNHLGQAIADLTYLMRSYRTSRGLGAAIAVMNTLDDQSLKRVFGQASEEVDLFAALSKNNRANLELVYGENWFKPHNPPKNIKMNQGDMEYPVEAVIGDRVVMYRSLRLATDAETSIDQMNFGYRLVRQAGDALELGTENNSVHFESVDEVLDVIKDAQDLLAECANTATSMKEIERMVNRVTSLGAFLEGFRTGPNDQLPENLRPFFQSMRAITGVMNTVVAFQPALFAHAVRTASAVTGLVEYTHKRMVSVT